MLISYLSGNIAPILYDLGLNMALANHPSSSDYLEQSIDMALAAADTASACHYLRNYAAFSCQQP